MSSKRYPEEFKIEAVKQINFTRPSLTCSSHLLITPVILHNIHYAK